MDLKITIADAASFLGVTLQAIHKKLKTNGWAYKRSQNRIYFGYETAKKLFDIKLKNQILAFQNLKGGVGKTELVNIIATGASLYGLKILCIDLDLQANLTQDCFQVDSDSLPVMIDVLQEDIALEDTIINVAPGIDLIPSRVENASLDNAIILKELSLNTVYKDKINPLRSKYDLILIDCPAALGNSVTAICLCVDLVVGIVTPDKHAISGLNKCAKELSIIEEQFQKKIPLKVVLNKYDKRNNLSDSTLEYLITHPVYSNSRYRTHIRVNQEFPNAVDGGYSIFRTLSNTTAKEDSHLLIREIINEYRQAN